MVFKVWNEKAIPLRNPLADAVTATDHHYFYRSTNPGSWTAGFRNLESIVQLKAERIEKSLDELRGDCDVLKGWAVLAQVIEQFIKHQDDPGY